MDEPAHSSLLVGPLLEYEHRRRMAPTSMIADVSSEPRLRPIESARTPMITIPAITPGKYIVTQYNVH